MLKLLPWACFFFSSLSVAQSLEGGEERFPVFPECAGVSYSEEENCFKQQLRKWVIREFETPESVVEDGFQGELGLLFEVTREGDFALLLVNAPYPELEEEIRNVFSRLPQVKPATYNNRAISMQFRMPLQIPLEKNAADKGAERLPWDKGRSVSESGAPAGMQDKVLEEYDQISQLEFRNPRAKSQINIPLSHELYSRFDAEVNQVGTNFHSASKPFLYEEVRPYYDFEEEELRLYQARETWFGRKLWNEHLVQVQGEDYWFSFDPGLDLQLGKELEKGLEPTFNNTRMAIFQGGLGRDLNFYTVVYESQGRFAEYFNRYAESIKPDGGNPAIIPGRGIAKPIYGDAYDYPVAEGYLSYSPSKFFNIQLGHGKNFIGDGYRSLLLSDNASPYPFLKLNTSFWKFKYTNTWMSLRDVRPAVTGDGSFRTTYMANHFLSFNVSKRLNLGFFESVMWENDNNRGFDLNYLNPVIFYRAIEFATGGRAGNVILGLNLKYKWSDRFNLYGQLLIDEFSVGDVFGGEQSWKNKQGFQLGLKHFDAFGVPDLLLQLEYNQVRPYTYSHNTVTLNYGHKNQSMAHLWGANFRELVGIGRYKKERYYASVKLIFGERGFDYDKEADAASYGGDIFRSEEERPLETGVRIGQGNAALSFYSEAELGYIINPSTNLKVYGNFIYRSMDPEVAGRMLFSEETLWLNFGIRTDIFNWYFDY